MLSRHLIIGSLVDRYPRESFTLATKLNTNVEGCDEQSAKQQFYTSLERTGAGYFDYYLLHALQAKNYEKYEPFQTKPQFRSTFSKIPFHLNNHTFLQSYIISLKISYICFFVNACLQFVFPVFIIKAPQFSFGKLMNW